MASMHAVPYSWETTRTYRGVTLNYTHGYTHVHIYICTPLHINTSSYIEGILNL